MVSDGSRRVVISTIVGAVLATLGLVPRVARADDIEGARRDFADGVRLFQRQDYEGARRLFKKADGEHHAAAIVYNLAFAEERLNHLQAAVDSYEAYVAEVGDRGEFSSAAGVAIAQIKSRATRLRIDSKPSGARLFVDGSLLPEPAPTTMIVPAGHHVIVAEGEGWRIDKDVEVRGAGDVLPVVMSAPQSEVPPANVVPGPSAPEQPPPIAPVGPVDRVPEPAAAAGPDGFVWGAAFAIAPYHLAGAPSAAENNDRAITQVMAGAILEVGHAVTDRFEFLGRAFLALGPDGSPSYGVMGGPAVSLRLGSSLWLGASFIGGSIETTSKDHRYKTGVVFGAMVEATVVVLSTSAGQWTIGVQPGLLLTDKERDNTAFFFPVSLGFRAF